MSFMDMVYQRESCRSYQDKPVSRELLTKMVEAGRLAPSGCNAQPWKFLVIDEPEAKKKMCEALVVEGGATGCPWRDSVPAFIALVEQHANVMPAVSAYFYGDSQRFAQGDIGMAAMNMMYEADDLGLATCVLGMSDESKMEGGLRHSGRTYGSHGAGCWIQRRKQGTAQEGSQAAGRSLQL